MNTKKHFAIFILIILPVSMFFGSTSAQAPHLSPPSSVGLELIGDNFDLSSGLTNQRKSPSVAYNSVDNEYMAVWFDTRNPGNNDIFGQRVSSTGALLGVNFPIVEYAEAQIEPIVIHNNVDNEYLIAWRTQQSGFFNKARGRLVSSTGTLLGEDFYILGGGHELSAVYNPLANEFLISGRGYGVRGRRVSNNGDLLGAEFMINSASSLAAPCGQVAYNSNTNEYLATYRDQLETAQNLKGRRISSIGTLIGEEIVISPIYTMSGNPAASVAFDPNHDRFLVVFGLFFENEVWGQFVSSSGELIEVNFPIAIDLASRPVPYVVYSSDQNAFVEGVE